MLDLLCNHAPTISIISTAAMPTKPSNFSRLLKGDLLVQLGRADDAHSAYEKAKAALSDEAAVGGLQLKLDDLAKGDA